MVSDHYLKGDVWNMRLQTTALTKNQNLVDGEYWIIRYLRTITNDNTQKIYGKSIYEFFNWKVKDGQITIKDLVVNPDEAVEYQLDLHQKVKNKEIKTSTYNARIKGVRKFYDWLIVQTYDNNKQRGLVGMNPFKNIKQLDAKSDTEGSDFLTEDEIMLMLKKPFGEDEHTKKRNLLMFILALTTGIRNDALVSIQLPNLQFIEDDWCITTLDKGSKPVKKAIREEYYNDLMDWYDKDVKYRTEKNKSIFNITPDTANRIIKKWAISVGLVKEIINGETGKKTYDRKITFHSLRTTSAIEVYKVSENIYEVQKFMMHEETKTTHGYTKKNNQVIKIGKNILVNINKHDTFDSLVSKMSEEEAKNLLLQLNSQTKAILLAKIQK